METGEIMIFDLSHTIKNGIPVYPGDPETALFPEKNFESDGYRLTKLETGLHAGTHIDMPSHLAADTRTSEDFPIHYFYGTARIYTPDDDIADISDNDIVLWKTGWEHRFGTDRYFSSHPTLPETVCERLIRQNVRMLGLDTPSPDFAPYTLHKQLSEAGIFIVENLCGLDPLYHAVKNRPFSFFAVPLKIAAEASPVRAFAITE